MRKGYMPYIDHSERRVAAKRKGQLSFAFSATSDMEELTTEQIEELYYAVTNYIESKRKLRSKSISSRVTDAFYTFNILPPPAIKNYLAKSGIRKGVSESLKSDWDKVGLDLWSSALSIHFKRPMCKQSG